MILESILVIIQHSSFPQATANIETPSLCRIIEMSWKRNQRYPEHNACTQVPALLEHCSSLDPYTSSLVLFHRSPSSSLFVSIDVPLFLSLSTHHSISISLQLHSLQQQTVLEVLSPSHETHYYCHQSILNQNIHPHFKKNLPN